MQKHKVRAGESAVRILALREHDDVSAIARPTYVNNVVVDQLGLSPRGQLEVRRSGQRREAGDPIRTRASLDSHYQNPPLFLETRQFARESSARTARGLQPQVGPSSSARGGSNKSAVSGMVRRCSGRKGLWTNARIELSQGAPRTPWDGPFLPWGDSQTSPKTTGSPRTLPRKSFPLPRRRDRGSIAQDFRR